MKLFNFRLEENSGKSRISADLSWEDCDRTDMNLFFETDRRYEQALSQNLEAFLVGCILPAMHHGEKRIHLEGDICPELRQNLQLAMEWIRHWYYEPSHPLVTIEASTRGTAIDPCDSFRTGFFLSGGIDCLATLQSNHDYFPQGHPGRIQDGLLIYGQNIESNIRPEVFEQAYSELRMLADEKDVTLIPVYTNIRLVDQSSRMFDINHGAILGSVAQAFSRRLNRVLISASDSIHTLSLVDQYNFKPHGSHPLLDPLYSSYAMKIMHDGISQSRLDKVVRLADWYSGLQAIKVCGPNWPGNNCCHCEKCVRTMLELLVTGVLHKSKAFPIQDVTPEMIASITIKRPKFGYSVDDDYLELIRPLERIGRNDLSKAITEMIDRSFYPSKNLKQKFRRFDAKYLDGTISKIKKKIMPKKLQANAK